MKLQEQLRAYIVETFLFGEEGDLKDDTSFLEQGIVDSTGVMELVVHLENAYGVHVDDAELLPENLDSIEALCAFIGKKTKVVAADEAN